jgi:transcriptional regulator with XRE-family HTH domain
MDGSTTLELLGEEQLRELVRRVAMDLQKQREESGTGDRDLGHILKEHREATGYTQSELAEAAQVTRSTVSKVESGDRGMSLVTFCLVAHVLGTAFVEEFTAEMVRKVEETGRVGRLVPKPPKQIQDGHRPSGSRAPSPRLISE